MVENIKNNLGVETLSPQDLTDSIAIPAVYTNRFIINIGQIGVRLTMGEQVDNKTYMRSAVAMSIPDAIALRDLLQKMLVEPEALYKKAMASLAGDAEHGNQ